MMSLSLSHRAPLFKDVTIFKPTTFRNPKKIIISVPHTFECNAVKDFKNRLKRKFRTADIQVEEKIERSMMNRRVWKRLIQFNNLMKDETKLNELGLGQHNISDDVRNTILSLEDFYLRLSTLADWFSKNREDSLAIELHCMPIHDSEDVFYGGYRFNRIDNTNILIQESFSDMIETIRKMMTEEIQGRSEIYRRIMNFIGLDLDHLVDRTYRLMEDLQEFDSNFVLLEVPSFIRIIPSSNHIYRYYFSGGGDGKIYRNADISNFEISYGSQVSFPLEFSREEIATVAHAIVSDLVPSRRFNYAKRCQSFQKGLEKFAEDP